MWPDVDKRPRGRASRVRTCVLLTVVAAVVLAAVTSVLLLLLSSSLHVTDATRQSSSPSWWRRLRVLLPSSLSSSPRTRHDDGHHGAPAHDTHTRHPSPARDNNNNKNNSSSSSGYRRDLAWIGLHYCKAAYCAAETLANWSCGPACALRRDDFVLYHLLGNASKGTAGFTGVDHGLRALVVAFRGSYNTANWIEDLSYWSTPYPVAACGAACAVHRGFYAAYTSVRSEVVCDVATLHARHPDYTLLLTGHSLGAAMALLTALDLVTLSSGDNDGGGRDGDTLAALCRGHNNNSNRSSGGGSVAAAAMTAAHDDANNTITTTTTVPPLSAVPMQLYTFGEPRVGNVAFARWAASLLSSRNNNNNNNNNDSDSSGSSAAAPRRQQHRITHARDVVPHLPPRTSGYTHVPHELWYSHNASSHHTTRGGDDDNIVSDNSRRPHVSSGGDVKDDDEGGSYRDCDDGDDAAHEDAACSEGVWATSVADHLMYLGVCTRCVCTAETLREMATYTLSARVRADVWADHVYYHHHKHHHTTRRQRHVTPDTHDNNKHSDAAAAAVQR